jgi:chloramphenicol-sensitive protein RarD
MYGLAAYGLWGVMPLYFWLVAAYSTYQILAHRVVWCFLFLSILLTIERRWPLVGKYLSDRRTRWLLLISSLLIATNWLIYIHGVVSGQTIQTSLGYFINPLVSVLLGVVFFRERLRPGQWLAVGLAALGVGQYVAGSGETPWIALSVACSFGAYGAVRKTAEVDGLAGLTIECLWLLPAALAALVYWTSTGDLDFGRRHWATDGLLVLSGLVTGLPLLFFGTATRLLPLSTMGFLQYLAPTLQFLVALAGGEHVRPGQPLCFALVWIALAIFTAESLWARRRATMA